MSFLPNFVSMTPNPTIIFRLAQVFTVLPVLQYFESEITISSLILFSFGKVIKLQKISWSHPLTRQNWWRSQIWNTHSGLAYVNSLFCFFKKVILNAARLEKPLFHLDMRNLFYGLVYLYHSHMTMICTIFQYS